MSADFELLQTYARTRDAQAFSALVANYSDMVYGTCLRILKNVADAEDATQECFLRLARDSAKVHTSLGAWLHRCATNECISRVRSGSASSRRERAYEVNRHEEKKVSAWGEVSDQVDRALEELPEELRQVLVGHFLERKTQTELAAELGVSPATMSRRINEGVEAIRKKLTRAGVIVSAVVLGVMLLEHTAQAAPAALMASLGKMAIAGPGASVGASAGITGGSGTAASGASAATTISSGTLLSGRVLLTFTGAALFVMIAACVLMWNYARRDVPRGAGMGIGGVGGITTSAQEAAARDEAIAALTPEDRRIYEMIYQLRMSTPPDKSAEWVSVVRNIAQTGKPAVPALVAELDGTRRDGEQRLLVLALRMIADPRSVPALIRAIPRVSAGLLGYDFPATDGESKTFLASHAVIHSSGERYGLSSLDAGITQCNAALEAITRHSEGHDAMINGARNDEPAEVARDMQMREELADRWQEWWKGHQREFVSEQDMATLKTARLDVVDPVGLARFGPIFPTGANVHLGSVREVTLRAAGTWDAESYIDFDAGRVYARNEGWRNVSPEQAGNWIGDAGVDAYARLTHPTDRAATSRICMVQGRGLTAWRIANERFDQIEKEVQSDKALDMGAWGATESLVAVDVATGAPKYTEYPVTFFFATREGGRGVMQVLGMTDQGSAMQLRYRMFEGTAVRQAPLAGALGASQTNETVAAFGSPHEVSLGAPGLRDDSALAVHSGKTRPQSGNGLQSDDVMFTLAKREWLQSWGGDLLTLTWPNRQLCGLGGDRMVALEVSPAAWDALAPSQVGALLARRDPSTSEAAGTFMIPDPAHDMPATWVIQTRSGELGMLQITELSNDHLSLHYKLIGGE